MTFHHKPTDPVDLTMQRPFIGPASNFTSDCVEIAGRIRALTWAFHQFARDTTSL